MLKSCCKAYLLGLSLAASLPCQEQAPSPVVSSLGPWERSHGRVLGGVQLRYDSVVDHVKLRGDGDQDLAELFYTAYFAVDEDGARDPSRPLVFAYNGGPGSASGSAGSARICRADAVLQSQEGRR